MEVEPAQINTNNIKGKYWTLMLPNYTPLDVMCFAVAIQPISEYYIYGKEIGEGGLIHLQCFIAFKSQKGLTAVKKLVQTQGHWKLKYKKSTMARASNYCKKGIHIFI